MLNIDKNTLINDTSSQDKLMINLYPFIDSLNGFGNFRSK